ncbi:MAG: VOC family protein [Sneathiella sp.]
MIDRLDHLVITVEDLNKTKNFYCDLLGMDFNEFGAGRQAFHFGKTKINIHIKGRELEPKAHVALPGTADLCFIMSCSIEKMQARLADFGYPLLEGPVQRTGATGSITSLYVRDPDQNLIELSVYDRT